VQVRISNPLCVIAMVCSKWADNDRSAVTTVHPSLNSSVREVPTFTMGSTANVIPDEIRGPLGSAVL
jgi:hypothetical protein